ncbi:MAG: cation transporting ATPase C-terminal domain-containing protein, partial [Muribaculaceae bacterium]|nr:cation transporting ATPase C-terminal domain-containing protein [Muribaculaceae bacterium]
SIVGVGGIFFLILLCILYIFENYQVDSMTQLFSFIPQQGNAESLTPYELSMFFSIFVFLQFWNMFNERAFETGKSAFHFKNCEGFVLIAFVILLGQIFIVSCGGECFNVTPLRITDWLIIIGSTSFVLWFGELFRLFKEK